MRSHLAMLFLVWLCAWPTFSSAGTLVDIPTACPTPHNDCTAACGTSCTYWSCEDHTTVPVSINELPTSFIRAKPQCTERIENVVINQLPLPAAQQEQVVNRVQQLPLQFIANSYACVSHSKPGPACAWVTGSWGACSATCGGGTQTRSVTCSGAYCDPATKPASSQACNPQACGWIEGGWGACSATCGGGTQTQSVTCSGSTCDPATKPPTSRSCNTGSCSWATSDWGGCSATCGGGTQSRSVWCTGASCDPATQPAASQSCNTNACAASGCNIATNFIRGERTCGPSDTPVWYSLGAGESSGMDGHCLDTGTRNINVPEGGQIYLFPDSSFTIGSRACWPDGIVGGASGGAKLTCRGGRLLTFWGSVSNYSWENAVRLCIEISAGSPLMIHLNASAEKVEPLEFTPQEDGINFDLLGLRAKPKPHAPKRISWYRQPDYYFITLPNAKGEVNGIDELFGDNTAGPDGNFAKDGYYALAKYDGMSANGKTKVGEPDGYITKDDPVLAKLRFWHDDNFDGLAQPNELRTADQLGIDLIDLHADPGFKEVDIYENQTTLKSVARTKDGRYHVMFDVWFAYWDLDKIEVLKKAELERRQRAAHAMQK